MTKEIAKAEDGSMPALSEEFMGELDGLQGLGYSEHADDSLIPILGILQDNSAEVKKKHDKYIEGAEPGMLIVRALGLILPAEGPQSPPIQPCGYQHMWVEWQGDPGEGAVVNQYEYDRMLPNNGVPEGFTEQALDPQNPDRMTWVNEDGNRLVETRYHFGHLILGAELVPVVMPMAGTNHGVSKQWTAQMKRFTFPNGKKMHSFFRHYSVETVFTQKGNNSWYKYKITDNGMISEESILRAGLDMFKSLEKREITVDVASDNTVDGDDTDDSIPV